MVRSPFPVRPEGALPKRGNRTSENSSSSPTVTLNVIGLCSVGWSTVGVPNIGYFGAFLGSQKGLSGLLNGSLGLSVAVGLQRVATALNRLAR